MKRWVAASVYSLFISLGLPLSGFAGLINGGFQEGLMGWTLSGAVTSLDGIAVLQTTGAASGMYETVLSQEGILDESGGILTFRYGFETAGPDGVLDPNYPSFFPDSFQVTVESGSLYEVFFLADQETGGLYPFSLPLSLLPGSPVRLIFSLLDEDDGRFSRAFLEEVRLGAEPAPEPTPLILLGGGLFLLFIGGRFGRPFRRCRSDLREVAIAVLTLGGVFGGTPIVLGEPAPLNVDDRIRFSFSSAIYDSRTGNLTGKMSVTNLGAGPLFPPLQVVITGISDPTVTVANPWDRTPQGLPYFDLSMILPGESLQPGESTPPVDLSFHNPNRVRFRWDQDVLALIDPPPEGPVIFNLCLIPGEQSPICEFSLEDFETADPEFGRIQTVPLPESYAHERVKVFLSDEIYPSEDPMVTIGDRLAAIDQEGAFVVDLLLEEGLREIPVRVTNPEGRTASRTLLLMIDLTPPRVRILTPAEGSKGVEAVQTVSGIVDDPTLQEVILIHSGQSDSIPVQEGRFSRSVEFPLGKVTIRVEGRDPAGNRGADVVSAFRVNAPEGEIGGTVSSGVLGVPLAGVHLSVAPSEGGGSRLFEAVTGKDGRYVLSGVPTGGLIFSVGREGYESLEIRTFSPGGEEPLVQNFSLIPSRDVGALALTGQIRDTAERPIPGAWVSVDSPPQGAETGMDGIYLLPGLSRESFILRAGKGGYEPQEVWVAGGEYDASISILVHSMTLRNSAEPIWLEYPKEGESLPDSGTIVGEFRREFLDTGNEASVRVNGLPAYLVGNRFMINRLPLSPGSNEVVVEVLNPEGVLAARTFPVSIEGPSGEAPFFLIPSTESGVGSFRLSLRSFPEVPFTLRAEGPATPAIDQEAIGYSLTFSAPGIYLLEGETIEGGKVVPDRIAVAVLDREDLEARLQGRWQAMMGALARGEIESALGHLTAEAAYRYRPLLSGMGEEGGRFFSELPEITLVGIEDGVVRARLEKDALTYFISFARDPEGFYRIHRF